jgi:hypothetical protein
MTSNKQKTAVFIVEFSHVLWVTKAAGLNTSTKKPSVTRDLMMNELKCYQGSDDVNRKKTTISAKSQVT